MAEAGFWFAMGALGAFAVVGVAVIALMFVIGSVLNRTDR